MSFKLNVRKTDDATSGSASYVFHNPRVIIGRESTNDLPLDDPQRIVSKQHAEIVEHEGTFMLTDLESKNFTYVNGERIPAGMPRSVRKGDTIRIGTFEMTLEPLIQESIPAPGMPAYDTTQFDMSFVNPFQEDMKALTLVLKNLTTTYDQEAGTRRDDALRDALKEAFGSAPAHELHRRLGHFLGGGPAPSSPRPALETPTAPIALPVMPRQPMAPAIPTQAAAWPEDSRLHTLVNLLLRATVQLNGAPWKFRHEFIGQTIMQSEESAFLMDGDAEVLKRNLFAPELTPDQSTQRMNALAEALDDVALHQLGLLDGYRAAVQEGGQRLLDQIDPQAIEEKIGQSSPLFRIFPFLAKAEAFTRLNEQLKELRADDWSAGERRTYRPAFVKAYLARMTSRRS